MEDIGWIKLYRKINDSKLWLLEPFTKAQAWVDLVLNANSKDGTMEIRGNMVTVKRGECGWSEITMAKRWKWSRNKVRRFLGWLEMEQQIEQQKKYRLTSITRIINYDEYQGGTRHDTTERQQTIHKQEVYNITKDILEYITTWNTLFNTNYKSVKTLEVNYKYWRETYSQAEILEAIKIYKENKTKHWATDATPELFLRTMTRSREKCDYLGELLNKYGKKSKLINWN